jgi:uncharacterized protein YegL
MEEPRGHLLPFYVVIDESGSMAPHLQAVNAGLVSLHTALLREPMAAAKVRFSMLGFSDDCVIRMHLADLRSTDALPQVVSRGPTDYGVAFDTLRHQISQDVATLKSHQYAVHRPAVFFLTDGQPSDSNWRMAHQSLVDRSVLPAAPNIIACGVANADANVIREVATSPAFGFIAEDSATIGDAIGRFFISLTKSIVVSGRSLGSTQPELVVERPDGFRMAIDVI